MQHIIQGEGSIIQTLKSKQGHRMFVVAGSSFHRMKLKDEIESLGLETVYFTGFTPNPKFEEICKGIDLYLASSCNMILAIGGGSAIDVAKCIKLAIITEEGKNSLIPPLVSKQLKCKDNQDIPFIAIPTTAGSGSESTHNAVMYYQGAKQTVTNDMILPDMAILDPSLLETLPSYQKRCTMMDALCQAIESWWSVNSTPESKAYSQKAIELIVENWHNYIFDQSKEAASQILLASNYSGRAINISATTAAHAMSYKITSLYALPHGHAVALCLPEIWKYMLDNPADNVYPYGWEALEKTFKEIAKSLGAKSVLEAIEKFNGMMTEMELNKPTTTKEKKKVELELLSTSVNPVRLKNNPVKIDELTAYLIYDSIVKEA